MAGLRLKHIYKVYPGGVRAVNDFNLEIKDKSFVVLVGPSGCGKSTTLRMIAGLESITSGQLYIDNVLVNDVESKNRDIAMVFQSYALYPNMTVYQNMGFSLKLRHEKPKVIDEKVRKAAEILEISELLDRKPKELSGGQRQRVALGRAIVREPNVFLLDEPLSNLDAKLRVQMRTEITKLHEKLQTTFVYVTHDQTEAMTMGDTIVVMNKGFIQQADSPVTLFEDPTNLFVATFLGSPQMNIIECSLVAEKDRIGVKLEDVEENIVWLRKETTKQILNSGIDLNKKYLFGIRPDHITAGVIVNDTPKSKAAGKKVDEDINGHVEVVEQLGDETIIYCKIKDHATNIVMKAPLTTNIKGGDDIKLHFNNERVYLFDKDSEHSLIGMPSYNKIPVSFKETGLHVGEEVITVDEEYLSHLLDKASEKESLLAIKPEHVSLEKREDNTPLNVYVDFVEERTNYNIIYAKIKGVKQYLIFRAPKDSEINSKLDSRTTIYLPLEKMLVFDENDDSLYAREQVYPNSTTAKLVTAKNGNKIIELAGGDKLVYPSLPQELEDGEYEFLLKQDKCKVVFTKKLCKELKIPYEKPNMNECLSVSCYDEEPQHKTNIIYVKIRGFEEYVTLLIPNDFSVYKMPKFKIMVPNDGFILK